MALPKGGSDPWPPQDMQAVLDDTRAWAAWWSGDLSELMATAGNDMDQVSTPATRERRFNLGPDHRRRFWQRRADARDNNSAMKAAHAPLAADIAETSADLLFGDEPDLTLPEQAAPPAQKPLVPPPNPLMDPAAAQAFQDAEKQAEIDHQQVQKRVAEANAAQQAELEDLIEKVQLWPRLLEGAEVCSAVGGVYLRPAWDTDLADHPLLSVVEQDRAIPDFRWGRLVAVTFWEVVHDQGGKVWRHLERHEDGVILHGLYQGTAHLLGTQVDLSAHHDTAGFAPVVTLPPGMPRKLLVSYVPNVLPNRRHRRKPIGRADYAGSESFLDSLDEVWSSLMRDFRVGQARIMAPDELLTPAGSAPGDGKTLDFDQELFTGFNIAEIEQLTDPIKLIQPDIRVEQHLSAAVKLVETIVSASGYSPQTFGVDIEGTAESGTARRIRERKTFNTTKRKRGYWKAAVEEAMENIAALNAAIFGGPQLERPRLDWPELGDDPAEKAQTATLWRTAKAMSIREAVKERRPDWDEAAVDEEVERITDEASSMMPIEIAPPEDEGDDGDDGPPPFGG